MEHYLEIVSVAKTVQICQCEGGKAALQVPKAAPQPTPTHPGLIIFFKGRVFTAYTVLSKHTTGSLFGERKTPIPSSPEPLPRVHSICPQTGFHPTQQQPKADCSHLGADEKHWKKPETEILISVRQKPKEIIPTSMNRQWNKPILVSAFLSCLPFTLLGFFSCRTERQQKEGLHD